MRLPFLDRPAPIPVLAKLVVKGTNSKSRLWLAARMAHMIADAFPGRQTGAVADSAYAGAELKKRPTLGAVRPSWGARAVRRDWDWPGSLAAGSDVQPAALASALSTQARRAARGTAPVCRAATCPRRSTSRVGMA